MTQDLKNNRLYFYYYSADYCPIFWLLRNCGVGEGSICADIIKELAPLMVDVDKKFLISGTSLIRKAADKGYIDVVKVLAPITNDPMMPIHEVHEAARNGNVESIKILAPFTNNPNAPIGLMRDTSIHAAARMGDVEIIKILAPLTDNPNPSNYLGMTPIDIARRKGFANIVTILEDAMK